MDYGQDHEKNQLFQWMGLDIGHGKFFSIKNKPIP